MARNRKRAKERRARRPQGAAGRQGLATAPQNGAPDPIEHAAPDVELANAQLAVGRPELVAEDEPALDLEPEGELEAIAPERGDGNAGGAAPRVGSDVAVTGPAGRAGAALPEPRVTPGNRLVGFLQGSWRELQRVQWPDRRQVVQATSVVIGFVIIAGAFLGLADLVASKLMNVILK